MSYQFPQPQGPFNPYAQQQFQQPQFPPQQQFQPPQFPPQQDMFGPPPGGMMGMPPAIGGSGSIRQHESGGFADDSNGNLNSGSGIFSLKNLLIATAGVVGVGFFAKWMGWIGGKAEEGDKAGGSSAGEAEGNDDAASEAGGSEHLEEEQHEEGSSRRSEEASATQQSSSGTTTRSEQE